MKVAKLVTLNIFILILIVGTVEFFCRMNKNYHLITLNKFQNIISQSYPRSSIPITSSDYGAEVMKPIPKLNTSALRSIDFSKFSYQDIDHNHQPERIWTPSADQQTVTSRFVKKIKGTDIIIYDVEYKLNSFGKRNVENQANKNGAGKFIIAAGDSFTYGEGINQGLDYPSQLASQISANWKIYNYGVAGDSANDFLLRGLADHNYFNQIAQSEGDLIWLYSEVQMQRLIFPANSYKKADYILTKPEYTLEDGQIYFHGFFKENQRLTRKMISFLSNFEIIDSFNLEIPKLYTEKNYQLFFALLDLSISTIENSGRKINRKIVINYFSQQNSELFTKVAREHGFIVLDVRRLMDFKSNQQNVELTIPVDGHPSSEAYWLLANALKFKYY